MREIKFRAWDNERSRMTVSPFGYGGSGGFDGVAMFENDLIPLIWMQTHKSRFEIMQYTGLKDKNSVEIYEGDIVKYLTRAVSHIDGIVWTGRVMYQYGAFRLCRNLHNNVHSEGMGYGLPYEYEVIGNIYENGELLK